jgi:mono/diheme cytochrome c family protein
MIVYAPPETAAAAADPATLTGDAAHGMAIYRATCSGCHGATGEGGGGVPALADYHVSQAKAVRAIVEPGKGMPKFYPGTLGAQDVADVAAFVRNFPRN